MGRSEHGELRRRLRLILTWTLSLLLVAGYFALPEGDRGLSLDPPASSAPDPDEQEKLDVVEVSPAAAPAGSALVVAYEGATNEATVKAFVGKQELEVLARRTRSLVVRLPPDLEPGRVKIRVASGSVRSKPYDVQIQAPNWRKPFRNLIGGFALLVFGIGVFARGVRDTFGLKSAHALARLAARAPAAWGLGAIVGVLVQSTTAAAGLLAGFVTSGLLAVGPAAAAFLGAQLGAATAPLVTGLIDAREGLLVVAVGVLWVGLASDRLSTALGRLVLGAGLIAFGLQTLRPGFDLFVSNPALLSFVAELRADGIFDAAVCALLGAALVAVFQGPAPAVVLVSVLAQTTAQWDLRTALAVLSGSGLGAAVGALLTTPAGQRCRRLAQLHLLLGLGSLIVGLLTLDLWVALSDRLVSGAAQEIDWGKQVLLPYFGWHLGVAFALSQLACVLVMLPAAPPLARWLERRWPERRAHELSAGGDTSSVVRARLLTALRAQRRSLDSLSLLALEGRRDAGRNAEHALSDAHDAIESLLEGPVQALPTDAEGAELGRSAFSCLQLQRSLEGLLRQAERLVDRRVVVSAIAEEATTRAEISPLGGDEPTLRELHTLLCDGLESLAASLEGRVPVELESARAREIRMNGLEARMRGALLAHGDKASAIGMRLAVLKLVDAYETAGNQVYRLAEALAETYASLAATELDDLGTVGAPESVRPPIT